MGNVCTRRLLTSLKSSQSKAFMLLEAFVNIKMTIKKLAAQTQQTCLYTFVHNFSLNSVSLRVTDVSLEKRKCYSTSVVQLNYHRSSPMLILLVSDSVLGYYAMHFNCG